MKTKLVALLLLINGWAVAQVKDGPRVILQEKIIDSLSLNQNQVRDKAKEWIGKTFTDAKKVITSETENSLVVNYYNIARGSTGDTFAFAHTLTVDVKDQKARVRISVDKSENGYNAADFFYPERGQPKKVWLRWLQEFTSDSDAMVKNLEEFLRNRDDW